MRRKEREIHPREVIDEIIRQSQVCYLAMCDGEAPYVVPLSFGYDGESLYVHSAKKGRKMELLRENPRVCFTFTPEQAVIRAEKACRWGFSYRSVVGAGRAVFLEDREEKRQGLAVLMAHYDDADYTFEDAEVDGVAVLRVHIDELTGKGTPPR